jgi:hypothetical protein
LETSLHLGHALLHPWLRHLADAWLNRGHALCEDLGASSYLCGGMHLTHCGCKAATTEESWPAEV